jgi:hypothetical protein
MRPRDSLWLAVVLGALALTLPTFVTCEEYYQSHSVCFLHPGKPGEATPGRLHYHSVTASWEALKAYYEAPLVPVDRRHGDDGRLMCVGGQGGGKSPCIGASAILMTAAPAAPNRCRSCEDTVHDRFNETFRPSMLVRNRPVRPLPGGVPKALFQYDGPITRGGDGGGCSHACNDSALQP